MSILNIIPKTNFAAEHGVSHVRINLAFDIPVEAIAPDDDIPATVEALCESIANNLNPDMAKFIATYQEIRTREAIDLDTKEQKLLAELAKIKQKKIEKLNAYKAS